MRLSQQELVGRQKPRRSSRYKAKPEYSRMIDASEPFTVSPERKRRYDREDEEEDVLIVELVNVSEDYVSDEDPDYVPDKDELEKSESSEDEDDDEDEDNENEEQGDNKELETVEETTGSKEISPHTATQPKESGEEMNEGQNGEAKNPSKQNISDKDKTKNKETATKGGEANHCEKNGGKEIEAKNLDSQKKEKDTLKMAAKSTQKNGTPGNKVQGRIVV